MGRNTGWVTLDIGSVTGSDTSLDSGGLVGVGCAVGVDVGAPVGSDVGVLVGNVVGRLVGALDGTSVGDEVGNDFIGWLVDDVAVTGTSQCSAGNGTIFFDGFESGNTSAWSNAVP